MKDWRDRGRTLMNSNHSHFDENALNWCVEIQNQNFRAGP